MIPKLNCNIDKSIKFIKKAYGKVNNVWVPLKAGYRKVQSAWGHFLDLLEYIQSDANQYVDTLFKPNQNTRVVMDIDVLSTTATVAPLFGGRDATDKQ